jgi:hypothetical protein
MSKIKYYVEELDQWFDLDLDGIDSFLDGEEAFEGMIEQMLYQEWIWKYPIESELYHIIRSKVVEK